MDLHLPETDGIQLTRQLKQLDPNACMIAATNHSDSPSGAGSADGEHDQLPTQDCRDRYVAERILYSAQVNRY
jgi:CheY-like chemotaxis protein